MSRKEKQKVIGHSVDL